MSKLDRFETLLSWTAFNLVISSCLINSRLPNSDIYNPEADARLLMTIDDEQVTLYFDNSSPMVCRFSSLYPINGGENYDHVLVNWDGVTGKVTVSVNTAVVDTMVPPYGVGVTLPA